VTPRRALVLGPDVAVESRERVVYVSRVPEGPIVVLRDVAALIWEEAQRADPRSIADRVADRTHRDAADIESDVAAFVSGLVADGLLVHER
jgi:hypothetical protein